MVARLLEKDPANRPGTAAEVAELLLPFALHGGARRDRGHPATRCWRLASRLRRDGEDAGSGSEEPRPACRGARRPAQRTDGFDIFAVHQRLISEYRDYTEGAAVIRDDRIAKFFDADLDAKSQWPDPWLSLNPFFADGGSVADLVTEGCCTRSARTSSRPARATPRPPATGRPIRFYRHQRDAIRAARGGDSYVLTTGTGSGKSLAYIVPIVDRVLRARQAGDRQATGQGDHRLPDERPGQQPALGAGEVPAQRVRPTAASRSPSPATPARSPRPTGTGSAPTRRTSC